MSSNECQIINRKTNEIRDAFVDSNGNIRSANGRIYDCDEWQLYEGDFVWSQIITMVCLGVIVFLVCQYFNY